MPTKNQRKLLNDVVSETNNVKPDNKISLNKKEAFLSTLSLNLLISLPKPESSYDIFT
jgi:hypothetical protein